jgi:hypothetical protein
MSRKQPLTASIIFVALMLVAPPSAEAGMPSITLSDVMSMRLQALSFFMLLFFVTSYVIYRLWNFLQPDFSSLPRITFRKALAMVFLWGLAFQLVLVMISGARELMTPGAWKKVGLTYKLDSDEASEASNASSKAPVSEVQ